MIRWLSAVFGVGLVILGFSEIYINAAPWLIWFDFIAAIGAFGLAAGLNERFSHAAHVGGPTVMAFCLCALGIIALSTSAAPVSQIEWNFAFAAAFLLTGLGVAASGNIYRAKIRSYYSGPYESHSSGVFGAGYPYSWASYGLMGGGGYDFSKSPTGHSGDGPRNYKRSDLRIEEDVNDRLTDHWGVDASDIAVHVKNQEVWLKGVVDSRHARRIAEDLAESVSGVKDVKNELTVRGKASRSDIRVA